MCEWSAEPPGCCDAPSAGGGSGPGGVPWGQPYNPYQAQQYREYNALEWEVNTIEDLANDQDWEGLRMFSQQHHISEGARQKAQAYLDNGSKAGLNGAPPGQYGAPPPGQYGAPPPGQYGAPPPGQYGAPPPSQQYGGPPPGQNGGPPPGQYGAPPPGQYGAPPPGQYGAPQQQYGPR